MTSRYGIMVAGTGSFVPPRVLTNHDLEQKVDTSDEWIRTRTGIVERHIAEDGTPTSELAEGAARAALEAAGMTAADLDLIVVATCTPDTQLPNTGAYLQERLGAERAACFSIEAACSGFLYAVQVAGDMLRNGTFGNAMVVGAEKLSSITNWDDRNTCVLFGDGAGAVVLRQTVPEKDALRACCLGSDGRYTHLLHVPGGGSARPLTAKRLAAHEQHLHMSGREVFKLAVGAMADAVSKTLDDAGMSIDQVRWLIHHQANIRIIEGVGKRVGIAPERVYINVDRFGNTSAASIPIALDEIVRAGKVEPGDHLLLTAFGAGLTWGAQLLRW